MAEPITSFRRIVSFSKFRPALNYSAFSSVVDKSCACICSMHYLNTYWHIYVDFQTDKKFYILFRFIQKTEWYIPSLSAAANDLTPAQILSIKLIFTLHFYKSTSVIQKMCEIGRVSHIDANMFLLKRLVWLFDFRWYLVGTVHSKLILNATSTIKTFKLFTIF